MASATIREGLSVYGIGDKVRALRLKKKMALVELGRHTGLSPALLSKIERGRLFPTLPTLLRIALVFSVGLDYFFAGAREQPLIAIVRKSERIRLPEAAGAGRVPVYRFESLDYKATERRFDSYFAEFLAASADNPRAHSHPGVELLFLISGKLVVEIAGTAYELDEGDSMYFDASLPHSYARRGARACHAVVVTSR